MTAATAAGFTAAHAVLQAEVDADRLAGVSCATLRHGQLIDSFCTGLADREAGVPMAPDTIHRAFSNTKLFTTVLVLMLAEQGHWQLDDPLQRWMPAFGRLRVLRPGAATLDDTEPLAAGITIRQLVTHTSGLAHGVFDPDGLLYKAYHASGVRGHSTTLAGQMDLLAELPLGSQPGTQWEYALGIDVLARLCELATGQSFGDALQARILGPLGLVDTGFVLRPDQVPRLAALYKGDLADPMQPGLERLTATPWPDAYIKPVPRQSGAGCLFSTQADMLGLLRQLMPGQPSQLLQPATLAAMCTDQLPAHQCVQFPVPGPIPSLGYGLGGAVVRRASSLEPPGAVGELQWGGLAGTHWFINPVNGLAGVVMCQRHFGFWHPAWFAYKCQLYAAAGH
ncbi:MAG: serine hydrolase [Aquabacterium sp.]|nr:serine hydrolase [Aquabacterium sp.]